MRRGPLTLRFAALLCLGALVLHELRYLIAHGDRADDALAAGGHGYLPLAGSLCGALLALAAAQLVGRLVRARRHGAAEPSSSGFLRTWLVASAALLVVHVGQELAEGLVAHGHAHSVADVLAHGGAAGVALALGLGALVALVLRGSTTAVAALARRGRRLAPPRARSVLPVRLPPAPGRPVVSVLASKLAGRAPPLSV